MYTFIVNGYYNPDALINISDTLTTIMNGKMSANRYFTCNETKINTYVYEINAIIRFKSEILHCFNVLV